MTVDGWIVFIISVGMFSGLFAWCILKVFSLSKKKRDDVRGAFDIYELEADEKRRK